MMRVLVPHGEHAEPYAGRWWVAVMSGAPARWVPTSAVDMELTAEMTVEEAGLGDGQKGEVIRARPNLISA